MTTTTAKANNPAPVNSGKAQVKSETPTTNIQAKPKVVGGNGDYTAPPKNTKTINTQSAKVDTTPTNKSIDINVNKDVKSVDVEVKGTGNRRAEVPSAFRQNDFASFYEARYNQTPSPVNSKIEFAGIRGESLSTLKPPPDPDLKKILDEVGINGINYRNGIPDFSPVSKAQVEIDYMLGGKGTYGGKARRANFVQSDQKLANQINRSPELARQFGMEFGKVSSKDIKKYREKNELTWHELNDVKTMQLVPTKINSEFGHLGGVGEINAGAFKPGGFANKYKEEILK